MQHPQPPFGSLVTILAPDIGKPTSEATRTLADLGEVETIRAWKEGATTERSAKGPVKDVG